MKDVDDSSFNLSPTFHLFKKYLFSAYYMSKTRDWIMKMSGKAKNIKTSEKTVKTTCLFYQPKNSISSTFKVCKIV